MTYVIIQNCCNDAVCVEVCPVDCIHPRPDDPAFAEAEQLYIDPATCVDCELCVEACPVDAIYPDHLLPTEYARFLEINAGYFELPMVQS